MYARLMGVKAPSLSVQLKATDSVQLKDLGLDLEARKAALAKVRAARIALEKELE